MVNYCVAPGCKVGSKLHSIATPTFNLKANNYVFNANDRIRAQKRLRGDSYKQSPVMKKAKKNYPQSNIKIKRK